MTKCPECGQEIRQSIELPLRLKKGVISAEAKQVFDDYIWKVYPKRNGKRIGKADALKAFSLIDKKKWPMVISSVINYANSQDVKSGIGIKDPNRFLKNDFWQEWLEPDIQDVKKKEPEINRAQQLPPRKEIELSKEEKLSRDKKIREYSARLGKNFTRFMND